jgi:hypothetical protein
MAAFSWTTGGLAAFSWTAAGVGVFSRTAGGVGVFFVGRTSLATGPEGDGAGGAATVGGEGGAAAGGGCGGEALAGGTEGDGGDSGRVAGDFRPCVTRTKPSGPLSI